MKKMITILLSMTIAFSCSHDDTARTSAVAQQLQLNYGDTKSINIGNDQNPTTLNISFVKVKDDRCDCTLCYSGGIVYVYAYFLIEAKGTQNADTLILKRENCIRGNLKIGDPSMDVESITGQKFGLVYITDISNASDVNNISPLSPKDYQTIITTIP